MSWTLYIKTAPSFTTMKFLVAQFKHCRTSLTDDEHSKEIKTATTSDNVEKVYQMVLDNRQINVREIAELMGISKERGCHIVSEKLGMRKLSEC